METVEVKLRIPREMHTAIKVKAADEGRTLTKQIIQMIKEDTGVKLSVALSK